MQNDQQEMIPTPTTIVEVMRPQPDGVVHGQPGMREVIRGFSGLTRSKWSSIFPDHQPGDHITRDGKRWEVVSVGCKQQFVGDSDHEPEMSGNLWVWVYEVKGVDDE